MSSNSNSDEEEILKDFNKIAKEEIRDAGFCGQGSFGIIRKAYMKDKIVAVKFFHQKHHFLAEIKHFPLVEHSNIIKLFGICPKSSFMVLEYAENGSLHHILHERRDVNYNLSHAINWCLQSARGVAYLHSLKPKPLMHRDLKPPNLLVFEDGRRIKLCDFGTLRMVDTEVTNQKGSAAWMAPEVFQTKSYTEKCDVYSWGIILWEVLSRRKPYEEIGDSFRIFWLVAQWDHRPPLLRDCHEVLEKLMIRCWDKESKRRPNIKTVENIMQKLFDIYVDENNPNRTTHLIIPTQPSSSHSNISSPSFPIDMSDQPVSSSESPSNYPTSSPMDDDAHMYSSQSVARPNIRLNSSSDYPFSGSSPDSINNLNAPPLTNQQNNCMRIREPRPSDSQPSSDIFDSLDHRDLEAMLSPDLIPIPPDVYNPTSMKIYENHKSEAQNYLRKYFELSMMRDKRMEERRNRSEANAVVNDFQRPDISIAEYKRLALKEKVKWLQCKKELVHKVQELKSSLQDRQYAASAGWDQVT